MDEIDSYLERLASTEPAPGGGSAATVVGALAAALCAMVARITAGSARHVAQRPSAAALADAADALRERFAAARLLDEEAYGRVVAAQRLTAGTPEQKGARSAAIQAALVGAAEAPLAAAGLCAEGAELVERAAALGNAHLVSDVECALHFVRAAQAACVANVRINHRYLHDAELVRSQDARLAALVGVTHARLDRLLAELS